MTYEKWLNEWLENYIKPSLKSRTYERYYDICHKRIINVLGDYELDELSPLIIQKFIKNLLENGNTINGKGLSSNTVNSIITVIKSSLRTAYNFELSKKDISNKIIRPKIIEKEIESFTLKEQKKIEKYILTKKGTKFLGIILCLYLGLRIGELLALEWDDVDFGSKILKVNKNLRDSKDSNGKFCTKIGTPKTLSSNRFIPLPKQIIVLLREMKKKAKSKNIIEDKYGKRISIRSYQRSFELILKKLEIKHKGFHALRHTFATRALECGMDPKTLADILGHKNPNITLKRYAHSMLDHKKLMMNKLGKMIIIELENV